MIKVGKARFLLPAGPGAFVCEFSAGRDISDSGELSAHLFLNTWLHDDQLHDDQALVLTDGIDGDRLGESILMPAPLRQFIEIGGGRVAVETLAWMPETNLARPMGRA